MEDRSLDDFVDAEEDVESTTGTGDGAADADGSPEGSSDDGDTTGSGADGVDPAAATSRVDPGGVACPACGETVERRWRDGGDFVCTACKEW
jgi:hypothetical protein